MRVQPTRPAELAEQPEASLALAGVTPRVKHRQRAHGPRDRVPKSLPLRTPTLSRWWKAAPRRRVRPDDVGPPGSEAGARVQGLPRNLGDHAFSVDNYGAGVAEIHSMPADAACRADDGR